MCTNCGHPKAEHGPSGHCRECATACGLIAAEPVLCAPPVSLWGMVR